MNYLDQIFGVYDKLIGGLPPQTQSLISLALLIFLVWQIYQIIKNGHWIFIALLIFFLPGTWPAARHIANLIYLVIQFLYERTTNS